MFNVQKSVFYPLVIGHQKQFQFLQAAKESGRLGHAFIFSGPARIGKKTAALEWLSRIFGTPLSAGSAHPDFLFVAPLFDPKTEKIADEITVDQIRGLIRKLSLKPALGSYKAAVIDEAHLMNSEAQNALLKTLEEPPGDALIVLIAQNSQRLLETIRSRCQTIQFNFVGSMELEGLAKDLSLGSGAKLDESVVREAVELSFGRPGKLAEFIADPSLVKKRQASAKEFAQAAKSDLSERFIYGAKIVESGNIAETIEIWQYHFRNLLLEALKPAKVAPCEVASCDLGKTELQFSFSKLKDGGNGQSPEKIGAILKKIHDLSVILQTTNASPKLAIENFMLDL